ncbi:MAG: FHA domain-containing protein [Bacteroidales bacterium]|nr:FHA domain-containing protein [Bacteroidales bacterium]
MEVKIGRAADNDIVVPASYVAVSKRHAKITQVDGAYYIEDLNSTNGTFINGSRYARKQITATDRITLGGCSLGDYVVDLGFIPTGVKPDPSDFSQQFRELENVYRDYQNETSMLMKKIRSKTLLPKTIIMIAFILVGLIACIIAKGPTYKIIFMSLGTVAGLIAQFVVKDRSVELENGKAEIMSRYQGKYRCPKCGKPFPMTSHPTLLKTSGCPSCGARFQ